MSQETPEELIRLQNLGTVTSLLVERYPNSEVDYQSIGGGTRILVTSKENGHARVRELLNSGLESVDFIQYCKELLAFGWEAP